MKEFLIKNKIFTICAIVVILCAGTYLYLYTSFLKIKLYEITYYETNNTENQRYQVDTKHIISIYNKRVIIKTITTNISSTKNEKTTKKTYGLTKYNMEELDYFLNNELNISKKSKAEINIKDLDDQQIRIISSLLEDQESFEFNGEVYQHSVTYNYVLNNDGIHYYIIYYRGNEKIHVKEVGTDEDENITKLVNYDINFSEKNMKILDEFFQKYQKDQRFNNTTINPIYIKNDTLKIFESISKNDEAILKDMNDIPRALYTIERSDVPNSCTYTTIEMLNDKTFEFTLAVKGEYKFEMLQGEYDSLESITSNLSLEKTNILVTNNMTNEKFYISEEKLNEFIESLNKINSMSWTSDIIRYSCTDDEKND